MGIFRDGSLERAALEERFGWFYPSFTSSDLSRCESFSHPLDAATEITGRTGGQLEAARQNHWFSLCFHQNNPKQCLAIVRRTKQGVYIFLIYSPMQTSRRDPIAHHQTFWGGNGQSALHHRRFSEQVGQTPPGRVPVRSVLLWGRRMASGGAPRHE